MACPVLTEATQWPPCAFCSQKALSEQAQCLLIPIEVTSSYGVVDCSDLKWSHLFPMVSGDLN